MKDTKLAGFRITNQHGLITIRQKPNVLERIATSLAISIWLTGCSAACFFLVAKLLRDFQWFILLSSIPFFMAWFAGAAVLLSSLFGTTIIQLSKDQLKHTIRVVIPVWSRTVLLKEISNITSRRFSAGCSALRVHSSCGDFDLLENINDEKIADLRIFLQQHIPTIDGVPNENPKRELVARKRKVSPLNCSWEIEQSFNRESVLIEKGSFVVGDFFSILGIALFWNVIVSVLAIPDWRRGDWIEMLYLIPFVLVGLALLAYLVFESFAPFRKLTYVFTDREIVRSLKYFGIGKNKARSLNGPVSIKIVEKLALLPEDEGFDYHKQLIDYRYKLTFNNKVEKILVISPLTLAEAEWIGTELENARQAYTFQRDIKAESKTSRG